MTTPAARKRALGWAEEIDAVEDVKEAFDKLAPNAQDLGGFFAAFAVRALAILSARGKLAIGHAGEFAAIRHGGRVAKPSASQVETVHEIVREQILEASRHAQEQLRIRARSMGVFGMTPELIAEALLRAVQQGGRTRSQARAAVSQAVGSGVNLLTQLVKHVAVIGVDS